jgi:hypothetical protein
VIGAKKEFEQQSKMHDLHLMQIIHGTKSRIITALLLCVGIFVLNNCCTLGLMRKAGKQTTHSCCAAKKTTGEDSNSQPKSACCIKGFTNVPIPAKAALPIKYDLSPIAILPLILDVTTLTASVQCYHICEDIGPPPGNRILQSVLKRSMQSHAPPILV